MALYLHQFRVFGPKVGEHGRENYENRDEDRPWRMWTWTRGDNSIHRPLVWTGFWSGPDMFWPTKKSTIFYREKILDDHTLVHF